jgi:NADH dehydrogenase FAD-containing subunit
MNTDLLLIGGGCGGFETALHLRKLVADATITIVNPRPHLIYRPWLMYLPAQHRHLEDLQISLHKAAATYRLQLVIDTVGQLDHQNRRALLAGGEVIEYRFVVVATGSPADRERLPGSAQHALFPCDVEEALAGGQELRAFDVEKARKRSGVVVPDCGGQTVMVMLKNRRVLASGRWPLLLRAMLDRRSLKGRR